MAGGERLNRIEGGGGAEASGAELALGVIQALNRLAAAMEDRPDRDTMMRMLFGLEEFMSRQAGPPAQVPEGEGSPWLTVVEAAERIKVSKEYIYKMIGQGRLGVYGKKHCWRVLRAQLDEQMARGWPRLDITLPSEAVLKIMETFSVRMITPRPKRPVIDFSKCPKLV